MILDFDKPKKARSSQEHNDYYSSDTMVPGTYVPNMSRRDMEKWKAKRVGGDDPRIEIRKTVDGNDPALATRQKNRGYSGTGHCSAQILVIVRLSGVVMSTNGRIPFDNETWRELAEAVNEAQYLLKTKKA